MDWRQAWYGHNRSFAHKTFTTGLMLGGLLSIYGLWIDFVSSELWWRWGSYLAAALALFSFLVICRSFIAGQLTTRPESSVVLKAVGFIVVGLFVFAAWWMIVVRVVPDIAARVLGKPAEMTAPMRAVHTKRRSDRTSSVRAASDPHCRHVPSSLTKIDRK